MLCSRLTPSSNSFKMQKSDPIRTYSVYSTNFACDHCLEKLIRDTSKNFTPNNCAFIVFSYSKLKSCVTICTHLSTGELRMPDSSVIWYTRQHVGVNTLKLIIPDLSKQSQFHCMTKAINYWNTNWPLHFNFSYVQLHIIALQT